jgi:hypothetical protein
MAAYRKAWTRVVVAGFLAASAGPLPAARAAWSADVTHDATGRLKVAITGDVDGVRSVYASCDPSRSAVLALLVPATDPSLTTSGMTLSFVFADGTRWASSAGLYRYDNTLVAVGYGNAKDVPAIMQALADAQSPVQIGLGLAGGQAQTWTADVHGSTAAARKFLDNCFGTN